MNKEQDIAIKLENVSKTFWIRDRKQRNFPQSIHDTLMGRDMRKIEAVKNVNLEVKKGEFLGIVGANGSGKSTLLHLMSGVYKPDKGGNSTINGNYIRLSLGLGFNQELTARENIYLNASIMGLTLREINKKFNKIIAYAELQKFVDTRIKYFSRGMKARLAFSVAIHAKADIILLDEFFGGVGDEKFRINSEKIFRKSMLDGRTIVLVSHNLSTIKELAHRVMLMHQGKCVKIGTSEEAFLYYQKVLKLDKLRVTDERGME